MECVCESQKGFVIVADTVKKITICCPIGSVVINGTCGCDSSSTATTPYYVAASTKNAMTLNLSVSNPLPQFGCVQACPTNSAP